MKKIYISFFVLFALAIGIYGVLAYSPNLLDYHRGFEYTKANCPFDNKEVIAKQGYYEGNLTRVLYNYKPLLTGHSLVIPKRHIERFEDLTAEEISELGITIKKVHKAFQKVYNKNDYLLVVQNGVMAGQTVPHVHFHMIPRGNEGILLTKTKLWMAFLTEVLSLRKPISDAESTAQTTALGESMKDEFKDGEKR